MENFSQRFKIDCSPKPYISRVIVRGHTRFTVLTPCLLRVESQLLGKFCDEPTQSVWHRSFDNPDFKVVDSKGTIEIITAKASFLYSLTLNKMLRVALADGRAITDYKKGNLKGTCRTLDVSAGIIKIGDGVCSKNGVAVLDDSDTLAIKPDGSILPREHKEKDIYFFAYGYDYIGATTDLYKLTGRVPLIPRYALSNWWSRYKAYTQKEYLELMDMFKDKEIPITVATVDMDWHWVNVTEKFGKDCCKKGFHKNLMEYVYDFLTLGWTGYSFNTDLFPDPDAFLKKLKQDNYHVTFNVHPSMGVRPFENQYNDMCRAMGLNPKDKNTVKFDFTDKKYIESYFDILHHPYENKGVDFWWIDWQQGKHSNVPGLDPLWALNHYHFLDNARDNHRPLILSRFCGAGSQRYPLGFSGDTTQTWKSLDFQPGFTATASNIAYPWWSHDIGGHCMGEKNDELYVRWVQLGVFSPIMRLHSTNNDFAGKEPWNFSGPAQKAATDSLRLRHKLLPYIYTMNYRTHAQCRAICEPMYYAHPKREGAYKCKNEFFFGSELIAAPITEHTDPDTNLASVNVWLPQGRYTDIFTGRIYQGEKFVKMYRDINSFPVLAKEGAIIPMSKNSRVNDCSNPVDLELLIYRGNNTFTLYEDDGETLSYKDGEYLKTDFTVKERGREVVFTINKNEGTTAVVPQKRSYSLKFRDIVDAEVSIKVNGKKASANIIDGDALEINIACAPDAQVEIALSECIFLKNEDKQQALTKVISKFQMSNDKKALLFSAFIKGEGDMPKNISPSLAGPIKEILAMD